jgi:hypothetical protein
MLNAKLRWGLVKFDYRLGRQGFSWTTHRGVETWMFFNIIWGHWKLWIGLFL